jgi:RAD50-interacting protein 1
MPVDYASANVADRKEFERAFLNLLTLQTLSAFSSSSSLDYYSLFFCSGEKIRPLNEDERSEKDGLYPLQALVQPLSLRFKYHFDGTRQTNRLDKVCVCFQHLS